MTVQFDHRDGGSMPVVAVAGEIDLANAAALRDAIEDGAGDTGSVVVDLTGVRFLGSAGVRVLFDCAQRLRVELVVPPEGIVAPVVRVSGLAQVLTVR